MNTSRKQSECGSYHPYSGLLELPNRIIFIFCLEFRPLMTHGPTNSYDQLYMSHNSPEISYIKYTKIHFNTASPVNLYTCYGCLQKTITKCFNCPSERHNPCRNDILCMNCNCCISSDSLKAIDPQTILCAWCEQYKLTQVITAHSDVCPGRPIRSHIVCQCSLQVFPPHLIQRVLTDRGLRLLRPVIPLTPPMPDLGLESITHSNPMFSPVSSDDESSVM